MEKDGFMYLEAQDLKEAYTKDLYCLTFLSRDVLLASIFKKGGDAVLKTSSGKVYVSIKIHERRMDLWKTSLDLKHF